MELQTTLVNSHIDELRQTARELHAAKASKLATGSAVGGLRRGVGRRLIGLGLALISQGQPGESRSAAPRMA